MCRKQSAVFACSKLPHSFEHLPWDTDGNQAIFVTVDGLWICNQPVMSRQQPKPACFHPWEFTRNNFFMWEDSTFQTLIFNKKWIHMWDPKNLVREKLQLNLYFFIINVGLLVDYLIISRSQWPRDLWPLSCWYCGFETRRGSVCCECCVLSSRGLCDEESYQVWNVVACHREAPIWRRPWPGLGRSATGKKNDYFICRVEMNWMIVTLIGCTG